MFIDEIEITLKGGDGGPGKVSFLPGLHAGPDGGNGGKGADLFVKANPQISNLNNFVGKSKIEAESGQNGGSNQRSGASAEDLVINLPLNTLLIDTQTQEEYELLNQNPILICIGGKGGKGNTEFKSSTNTTPTYAQKGLKGQERHFKVHVRLIADYGLIGLPNAGKSSLLNELTNAGVKVASYPFTTLQPNLGVINNKVVADIPGLIEGASEGKGLGIKFLKHIEKVKLLLHCIAADSENVKKDYQTIIKELKQYKKELLEKKQIIVLTKSDLVDVKTLEKQLKVLRKLQSEVIVVSIHDWDSIEKLKKLLS